MWGLAAKPATGGVGTRWTSLPPVRVQRARPPNHHPRARDDDAAGRSDHVMNATLLPQSRFG